MRKACFYAPATRDVHVELPPEQAQAGVCVKLLKFLYGTRDAALIWSRAYCEVLDSLGFEQGKSSPCSLFHKGWGIRTVVHGEDFVSEGPGASLLKMDAAMRKSFSLKTEILGGDPGDVKRIQILIV